MPSKKINFYFYICCEISTSSYTTFMAALNHSSMHVQTTHLIAQTKAEFNELIYQPN